MSDDPRLSPSADTRPDAGNGTGSAEAGASGNEDGETVQSGFRKRFAIQTQRKADFIHDIMFNLDILIYAEICVLYYMEWVVDLSVLAQSVLIVKVVHSFDSSSVSYSRLCS